MFPSHASPQAGPALSILASLKSWQQTQACLQTSVEWTELPPRAVLIPYPGHTLYPAPTRAGRALSHPLYEAAGHHS